jgi:hypothetical protein
VKPEGSLQFSQELSTGPYSEIDESSLKQDPHLILSTHRIAGIVCHAFSLGFSTNSA